MPSRPISPPPGKPITELRTANQKDGFLTVLVQRDSDFYQQLYPVPRGTPYAKLFGADTRTIAEFASNPLLLLREIRPGSSSSSDFGNSDLWVIWVFATVELAESNYDFDRDYPGEDVNVPRYVHTSTVRRNTDEAAPTVAYGSALTALISVNITAAGANYTTATGTVGNATVSFVCFNGQLILGIVTNEGSGITAGAAITITGDGTGATATARIQPATAILTHQEKKELPKDDPRSHDYVQLVRVYEVLPGPWLPFTRYDDQLGPIQGRRRAVVNTGQIASLTSTVKTTYEAREGSSYVSWQIEEYFGAGVPGFTAYPLLEGEELSEQVRAEPVHTESQVVDAGTPADSGSLIISSIVTAINDVQSVKVTKYLDELPPDETWYEWRQISLPLLVFDILNTVFCNATPFFTMVTNPDTGLGASEQRKHRVTVSYYTNPPELPMTVNLYETTSIRYQGKVINFSYGDSLIDAISYDEDFITSSEMSACGWTEEYDLAATTPSATDFAAGDWFLSPGGFRVEPYGQEMYRAVLTEFYSAPGEPPP